MIGAIALIIGGAITALLCAKVALRYKGGLVPVHWLAFVMMGSGALAIMFFFIASAFLRASGMSILVLVPFSRILFWLVLIVTSLMAVGALWYGGDDDFLDE